MKDGADGRSAATKVRDAIENEILMGVLRPGERLDEQGLSQRFGVSRTPVREALAQLASLHQVELKPNRGAFVTNVRPERLVQMFEVMSELEGMAGRLAARRMSAQDRDGLSEALARCDEAAVNGDSDAYYYENEHFHQAIYQASRNGFLIEQCILLQRRLRPYRRLQLRALNRIQGSLMEHREIVGALLAGDGQGAETALRAHVAVQGERFEDLVAYMAERVPA